MLSRKKIILFSLTPAILLMALLALAEIALRLFVPSLDSAFASSAERNGKPVYQINRGYLERYFPLRSPMVPELRPALFRTTKDSSVFRVACLGESSMFGTPYDFSVSIPTFVRKQLRHLAPGRTIEVMNLGASAINSNVIADIMPRVLEMHPDLILIYTGHNEFYGPDGVGASWMAKRFPFLIRLKYAVADWRLVRLLRLAAGSGGSPAPADRNLMKQVSEGARVDLHSDEAARIFDRFGSNLADILGRAREACVPVIVSDIASNLNFPPFGFTRNPALDSMDQFFRSGRYDEMRRALATVKSVDSANAMADYWRGRVALISGDDAGAFGFLRRARDEDLLKFRAPGKINEIIRKICAKENVICVSSDSVLASMSPYGVTDTALFTEHLHPNARGYDAIARSFLGAALRNGLVPAAASEGLLPFDPDSLSISGLDLAYADLSLSHLGSGWPFENYRIVPRFFDSADSESRTIALNLYNRKIGWTEAGYRFAARAEQNGNLREACRTYESILDNSPDAFEAAYRLGRVKKNMHEDRAALRAYRRALSIDPSHILGRLNAGLLEINEGEFDSAASDLRAVMATNPAEVSTRATTLYGLAAVEANRSNFPEARRIIDEALRISPNFEPALALRRSILSSSPK